MTLEEVDQLRQRLAPGDLERVRAACHRLGGHVWKRSDDGFEGRLYCARCFLIEGETETVQDLPAPPSAAP
jgi:hypothetical protein